MSRSWITLIIIGIVFLVLVTGFEIYGAISGQSNPKRYNVDQISPDLGQDAFDFLEGKEDLMTLPQESE